MSWIRLRRAGLWCTGCRGIDRRVTMAANKKAFLDREPRQGGFAGEHEIAEGVADVCD